MSDLFASQRDANRAAAEPLAVRMRPGCLEDFVGQEHFLGAGKLLRRMLNADRLTSVIFYGPPGVGKTTLAQIIAASSGRDFQQANASAVGVSQVRDLVAQARRRLELEGTGTIFFLDEIHRFNRAQQDVLLADVERGTITLIGATTQNPFFAINAPLVSRSAIFQFKPLGHEDLIRILRRAIADRRAGYGQLNLQVTDEALEHWAGQADGDARRALNALEVAVLSSQEMVCNASGGQSHPGPIRIDMNIAEQAIQRKALVYDGTGDDHYDVISAFIKSMRGSDPDAAVYWLARMLEAGEDPLFIARRIAILASEDIGNADPVALSVACAACQITERIGMPECQLTLAQATIYMATAPKSNASAKAIWQACQDVREGRTIPVPDHLRDGHYAGARTLADPQSYQYSHDSPSGWVDQVYLGAAKTYYHPTQRGHERRISRYLNRIKQQQSDAPDPLPGQREPGGKDRPA